ncbi:putative leucine-rich repeat protein [Tanacetum coccineum]
MRTSFHVIFTLLFLHSFGAKSNVMMQNSLDVTCIERERESLLKFKERVMDESNRLLTWTGVECCEWVGVQCDWRNGRVVKIDLRTRVSLTDETHFYSGNRLGGEILRGDAILSDVKYLNLLLTQVGVPLRYVTKSDQLWHLDLLGIMIGSDIDWFHPANMLPSLLTLNLAWCTIDIPSIRVVNYWKYNDKTIVKVRRLVL